MENIAEIKKNFSITEQDLENISQLGRLIKQEIPSIINQFYLWVRRLKDFKLYFPTEAILERVKQLQSQHWYAFFEGKLDEQYILNRQHIGNTHARINLPLDIYYESIVVFADLYANLFKQYQIQEIDWLFSFNKLMHLDTSIVVKTYSDIIQKTMQEQYKALREMSTPVAEVWDGILFLPLVGIIDSKRAQDVMLTMLQKVATTQSKVFILDISGVGVVDTAVANHLIKVTKATKLMGCLCIISGISPAVAQTMVELGIQIDEISTTSTLKDALQQAFKLTQEQKND